MEAAMRHAPPSLISAGDRERLVNLAQQLPNAMSGFGFECRLRADDDRVDFYGSIGARGNGRQALATFSPVLRLGESDGSDEAWCRLGAFARRWADATSPLHTGVGMVFLEFDAPFASFPAPLRPPALFARLALEVGDGDAQWRQAEPLVGDVVSLLLGTPLPPPTRAKLHEVFAGLPLGGHVVDVAAMLSRGSKAVRVFASIPRHHLSAYLGRLGWQGAAGDLETALGVLTRRRSHVSVQLDVSDQISRRIGIETSGDPDPTSHDAWWGVIARATAQRLCTPEKQNGLTSWLGTTRQTVPASGLPYLLHRVISHVKLVIDPGQPLEAKAYLWVAPQFSFTG
jgi:hypothetical protein